MVDGSDKIKNNTKQQSKQVNGVAKTHQSLPGTTRVGFCLVGFYGREGFCVVFVAFVYVWFCFFNPEFCILHTPKIL